MSECKNLFDLAKRVKRGVNLLDRKFPGWRRVMRKHDEEFDLVDGSYCVLGTLEHHMGRAKELAKRKLSSQKYQEENGFGRLVDALNITPEDHGFDIRSSHVEKEDYTTYKDLEHLWRAEYQEGKECK